MSGTQITNSQKHTTWTTAASGAQTLTQNTSTRDATEALTDVAVKLKESGGKLAIWNSNNTKKSGSAEAKFMRKWFVSAQRKERTAEVVKNLFEKSSQRLNNMDERKAFMASVTTYLGDGSKAIKGNGLHKLVQNLEQRVTGQASAAQQDHAQQPQLLELLQRPEQAPQQQVHISAPLAHVEEAHVDKLPMNQPPDEQGHADANAMQQSVRQQSLRPQSAEIQSHFSSSVSEHLGQVMEEDQSVLAYLEPEQPGVGSPEYFDSDLHNIDLSDNPQLHQSLRNDDPFVEDEDDLRPNSETSSEKSRHTYKSSVDDDEMDIDALDREKNIENFGDDDDEFVPNRLDKKTEARLAENMKIRQQEQLESQYDAIIEAFSNRFDEASESIAELSAQVVDFEEAIQALMQEVKIAYEGFENTAESQLALDKAFEKLAQNQQHLDEFQETISSHMNQMNEFVDELSSDEWQDIPAVVNEYALRVDEQQGRLDQLEARVLEMLNEISIERPNLQQVMADLNERSEEYLSAIKGNMDALFGQLRGNRMNAVQKAKTEAIQKRDVDALEKANNMALALKNGDDNNDSLETLTGRVREAKQALTEHMQWLKARGFDETSQAMKNTRSLIGYGQLDERINAFTQAAKPATMPEITQRSQNRSAPVNAQLDTLLDVTVFPIADADNASAARQHFDQVASHIEQAINLATTGPLPPAQQARLMRRLDPVQNGMWQKSLDDGFSQLQSLVQADIRALAEKADSFDQASAYAWQTQDIGLASTVEEAKERLAELDTELNAAGLSATNEMLEKYTQQEAAVVAAEQNLRTHQERGPNRADRSALQSLESNLVDAQAVYDALTANIQQLRIGA